MSYDYSSIEKKWQQFWEEKKTFKTPTAPKDKKLYVLDMFPYPSGSGLHMGHPLGYTGTDIYSRAKRMQGYSVLHPMGYDAFGLPAEQYAIATGEHPGKFTEQNCQRFTQQCKDLGFSYDWDREIASCNVEYYHWTQWIFTKLYNSWFDEKLQKARPISELPIPSEVEQQGLLAVQAYQADQRLAFLADSLVNWCPALGTVLANEEVIDGRSERGNHEVVRKPMRQWSLRITKYAERLLSDLVGLDWPEAIKEQQRNWIGRSEGVNIKERIKDLNIEVMVYDSIPQTFLAQTFCVIAPEHPLIETLIAGTSFEAPVRQFVEDIARKKMEKRFDIENDLEGIFTGRYIENPFGTGDLPIWIASYVLVDYGTGMVNCSAHDQRDFDFAKKYGIPLKVAMLPKDPEEAERVKNFEYSYLAPDGILLEPQECQGMTWTESRSAIINYMVAKGWAERKVNYRLRDWLFSRQRYWGEPIPIIHWEDGRVTSVEESDLPLTLPEIKDYKPSEDGESPLAKAEQWLEVVDAKGIKGRRETNTMPQWAGSCWYYLRFIDPHNPKAGWEPDLERSWMPVDLYVGGAEHAVLHLLYARFWHKVLFDLGYVSTCEPFQRLFNQGMLVSSAFKDQRGALVAVDVVKEVEEGKFQHLVTGEFVEKISAKMSKSLKNVVTPDEIISTHGADTLRMFLMFLAPLEQMKTWNTKAISGVHRFLHRTWALVTAAKETGCIDTVALDQEPSEVQTALHALIKKVTEDVDALRFNTSIAAMMEFLNLVTVQGVRLSMPTIESFVKILSPFAPHMAEELWQRLGHNESIALASWPTFDPSKLIKSVISVVIQIEGKKRATIDVPAGSTQEQIKELAIAQMVGTNYLIKNTDKFIIVFDKDRTTPRLLNVIPQK